LARSDAPQTRDLQGKNLSRLPRQVSANSGREQMQQTTCANAPLLDHLVGDSPLELMQAASASLPHEQYDAH
jgi:hypothetical protein